ncbi:uncharacterized protein cubi_00353 [Cryptosporidium ubiquitum]|uniref:Uncharacterized protein n=1 Tax=Cryptosporidium ubiquitum TaxID=857276 RepID=A0A1J4MKR3_9CRYT|nr:uncharacterized protein cubi_00353 [Cryptosporidium ubiquitum]OII74800.1 hypothetical protein cubi_00353 [Cryptosporidium ubiquitum]
MKLSNTICGVSLGVIFLFFLGNVVGVHINKELHNLSIESEGSIKADNSTKSSSGSEGSVNTNNSTKSSSSSVNNINNSTVKGKEQEVGSQNLIGNRTGSSNNITAEINNNNVTINQNMTEINKNGTISQNKTEISSNNNSTDSEKYHIYSGEFDVKTTLFENGIAYDVNTGLPILPNLMSKLENDYDFDDMPALKEALEVEIGWIIIGICLGLLAIMIITVTTVSVIKHRKNRARREA